jgi:hypothetical protein
MMADEYGCMMLMAIELCHQEYGCVVVGEYGCVVVDKCRCVVVGVVVAAVSTLSIYMDCGVK